MKPIVKTIGLTAIVLAMMSASSVQAAVLVGHYTFDDANNLFKDSSTFGNDGSSLAGSPVQGATAIAGAGALFLNGTSAGEFNAIADDVPTGSHTISAWIHTTATNRPTYVSANTAGSGNSNMLFITAGSDARAQVFSDPPGSFVAVAANTQVNDGQYHHVVWVRDGSDGFLYVDGVLEATANNVGYVRAASDLWSFGQEFDGSNFSDFFNGFIDDVQVYSTAANAGEVANLFSSPGSTIIPEPATATLGLLGLVGFARRRRRLA